MNFIRLAALFSLLTAGVVVQGQSVTPGCLFTIEQLIFNEERVDDYSVVRQYVICENQQFAIGTLNYDNEMVEGSGTKMLPLRPNLHIRCGATGERENNCVFNGGDVQVDGTNFFGISEDLSLENIVIEGFTFVGAGKYSVWATKKGDITFVDCEWRDITESYAPVYFDFYDASSREPSLRVDFVMSSFVNNRYFGDGSAPALVTANGEQNRLFFDRCRFENNDMIFNNTQYKQTSYLIESSGLLRMSMNCFLNNTVGVAIAAAYGTSVASDSNYGIDSSGNKCAFTARFDTRAQFDSFAPTCDDYESASVCFSDVTGMPSVSPTDIPSASPTASPTNLPTSPSALPSVVPSDLPSVVPTIPPPSSTPSTSFPTVSPTLKPSDLVPSASPSASPTTGSPTITASPTSAGRSMRFSCVVAVVAGLVGTFVTL